MKRNHPSDEPFKFSGNLRHYHRSGAQRQRTWDEWVEGPSSNPHSAKNPSKNWLKIIAILIAGLALAGVIAGLAIELR
jgi:hypothetical protein